MHACMFRHDSAYCCGTSRKQRFFLLEVVAKPTGATPPSRNIRIEYICPEKAKIKVFYFNGVAWDLEAMYLL